MANGTGYSAGNLEFALQTISNNTISSLDAVIAKLKTITTLIGSTSSISKTLSTTTGRTTGGGASFNIKEQNKQLKISSLRLSNILNQVYFIRNYTKQTFRSMVSIVKNAVDYTETLNLWQVAMRGNTQEAEEFIKTMNKGYGVATQTLMQYQAIFRNMLSSLGGLTSDASYALSEYLTQMAFDYASLYNVSIQKAMTTFQSVLSGQVRPIRSIAGYDITETTIYQLYQQLGGTKTMRQLSQTEKRLLRIYAVFQQMESSGAVGDLSKTMESTANQMRVFSESAKELGTWVGILLEHYLKPILPVLNAVTITFTNIVKAIAQMNNIKPQEFGVVESVAELNEELDKTQGKLLSFDRFEALNSSAGEDNALGIDEKLLAGLSKYESIMGGLEKETQRLVDAWASFWFVDGDYTKGLTEEGQNLLNVLKGIGIVLVSIIGLKIGSKILGLIGSFSSMTGLLGNLKLSFLEIATTTKGTTTNVTALGKAFSFIVNHPIVLIIAAITGALIYLYNTNEKFRKSVNMLFDSIVEIFNVVYDAISPVLKEVFNIIKETWVIIEPLFDWMAEALANVFMWLSKHKVLLAFLINPIVGIIYTIKKYGEEIKNFFIMIGRAIGNFFINLWKGIANGFAKMINNIVNGFITGINGIISAINNTTLLKAINTIGGWFGADANFGQIPEIQWRMNWKPYKNGGQVEDGRFTMSKGEIIGDFDDGTTIVANNQQVIESMKQGVYSAVVSAMRQIGGNGGVGDVYLDGRKVGQTTSKYSHQENVRIGLVRATR